MRTKNDEKQIEEMARIALRCDYACKCASIAKAIYNAGYRRIPEGAVILTKEEIAALNEYQKKHCSGGESLEW